MVPSHSKESDVDMKDPQTLIGLLQTELSTTNHEVMLLTLELEQRVAERMAQLSETNAELVKEIAERRRAEEEVKQLNRDLQQRAGLLEAANEELETFSYSVSHDLRAPLRHILGYATMLHEEANPALGEKSQQHLTRIKQSATKMSTLIDELLHFSRFSHVELNRESVDLNAIVDSVIRDHNAEVQGRNVVWKHTQLPGAWGDVALLRQVVVNLISNALKYSRLSNPAEIEISVLENDSGETVFFVRDNGVGFDPAAPRPTPTLGMSSMRERAEGIGGRLTVESELGRGTRVTADLPIDNAVQR